MIVVNRSVDLATEHTGDAMDQYDHDEPINLEESSFHELHRDVVRADEEEDTSSSTRTPELPPHPHAGTDSRELLHQPFGTETNR